MLKAVARNTAMDADLCVVIARHTLPFLVGAARILPETGALPWLLAFARPVVTNLHRMCVVKRDRPGGGHRVGIWRELVNIGWDEVRDAHPDAVALPPGVYVDHARRGLHPVPFPERTQILGEPLAAGKGVQKREMRRVHAVFFDLEPIAFPERRRAG